MNSETHTNELDGLRSRIDAVDAEIVRLFKERMEISEAVANFKKANGLPVLDESREQKKISAVKKLAGEKEAFPASVLYGTILDLSRARQDSILKGDSKIARAIGLAIENTPKLFPEDGMVACQGIEGAYSQLAAQRVFRNPDIMYCNSFDAVFSAIEGGLCQYGVLPLENSTAGSVTKIYDLMMEYRFSIARSVRVKIDHCLLARPGATLDGIKEVYSHEQALGQSAAFLGKMPNAKVIPYSNTAAAAKAVAASGRSDVAAISSRKCAELYGLSILAESIQDKGNNSTRFICITKPLEIYPGASRTSVMLTLPHRAGSLYRVMSRINSLGINLNKLESRPIPERDFEFMFYFDLDVPVYSPNFIRFIEDMERICETFHYLGSYTEIV